MIASVGKKKYIMMLVSGKWKWKFSKENVVHSKDVTVYKQCFSGFVGSIESIYFPPFPLAIAWHYWSL